MRVLVACEESQSVTKELRRLGHEAYSCDLQECTGGHPEWHVEGDCLPLINGNCTFTTVDGQTHTVTGKWDLLIAHPPCTYLSHAATQCHSLKCYPLEAINERTHKRAYRRTVAVGIVSTFNGKRNSLGKIAVSIEYRTDTHRRVVERVYPVVC